MAFLKNTSLAIASLVLMIMIAEIFLRLGGYKIITFYAHAGFHQYEPDLGWAQIPSHDAFFQSRDFKVKITSNSHGFRDDEYTIPKREGMRRILVLGDSFAWGWGVEKDEIFCEVAEKEMDQTEFLNLGHTSYGTAQELLIQEKLGLKFSPDYTVLAFYPNDIHENSVENRRRPKFVVNDGTLVYEEKPAPFSIDRRIKKVLQSYFYLYSFVDYRIALLKRERTRGGKHYHFEDYFYRTFPPTTQQAWEVTKALILKIQELVNHKLLILYVPDRLQVETDTYSKALQASNGNPSHIDILHPNTLLREFTRLQGIPFLDTTPILRTQYANGVPIYFDHDIHWTKEAHHIVGQHLKDRLEELLESRGEQKV